MFLINAHGDMNIDLFTPNHLVENYLNIIEANNATVMNKNNINLPTRPASNTVTDYVISSHHSATGGNSSESS